MRLASTQRPRYSDDFKKRAISLVERGRSPSAIAKELNIQNPKTLENWVRRHEAGVLFKTKRGKNKSGNVLSRRECLLEILPSYPGGMTNNVMLDRLGEEGYLIHEKTLQRDLSALMERQLVNRGDEGWYKVANKSGLRINELRVTDALSLALLERFLQPILPAATTSQLKPVFEQAKERLEQESSHNKLAHYLKQVAVVEPGLTLLPAKIDQNALAVVQEALLADQTVKVDYAAPGKPKRTHILTPLGIVQCGVITYLVATGAAHPETLLRLPMHRVKSAERTYERSSKPKGFSLKHFIEEGGFGFGEKGPIKLKAWVSSMLGERLLETSLGSDQVLKPLKDGFELTVTLIDSWRLRWWILSKTGDIVVRGPKALREDIAGILHGGAAQYV
jgi:predicted DNA-binding transcriptional regulator YafY